MALVQKAFSDIITFSRSSNATRVGPNGLVEYAPHNLLTYSQELGTSSGGSTVTANVLAAPDGTVTADKITGSTTYWGKSVSITSGTITFSIFLKSSGDDSIDLYTYDGGYTTATVNLANGTITGGTIQNIGNGWYRCSLTKVISATVSEVGLTGISASGVYAWGAQLSVGPLPLDYTPTTSAAVYGQRFDYDPVTLAARGLLVEEQRTNLVTYSEQFDNAAWATTNATVSANNAVSPDGQTTADKLVESVSGVVQHKIEQTFSSGLTSSTAYTFSVFVKTAGRSWIALEMAGTLGGGYAYFNIANGTIGTEVNLTGTSTITAMGNGWYRCSVTDTSTGSGGAATKTGIFIANADNSTSYAGDGASGILVWGAQLEAGSFATSYIPTLASTVTRSADVASVNTLSPWFNATEGTLFVQAEVSGKDSAVYQASLNDATLDNIIGVGQYLSTRNNLGYIKTSGVDQAIMSAGTTQAVGSINKQALAYKLNDSAISLNGGAVATDTSNTIPIVSRLDIGVWSANSGTYLNGHIQRIAYYPRRLQNAELQALSA